MESVNTTSILEKIKESLKNPEKYIEYSSDNKRNIQLIIDEFKDKLKDISGKCMDVGCGPGDSTLELLLPSLHLNATLIGTDKNKKVINYAKTNYCKSERLQFEEMDIETTDLHEKYINTFDHIFSFHTLHWCLDIKRAFRNIHRMLRLNGTVLLCYKVENGFYIDSLKALSLDSRFASYHVECENLYKCDKHFVVKTDVKDFLERIGFHVHTYCHKPDYCLTEEWERSLPVYIDIFINPLITDLPDSLKTELKEQVKEEVRKNSIDPNVDDTLRRNLLTGDRVVVFAKKCKESIVE